MTLLTDVRVRSTYHMIELNYKEVENYLASFEIFFWFWRFGDFDLRLFGTWQRVKKKTYGMMTKSKEKEIRNDGKDKNTQNDDKE